MTPNRWRITGRQRATPSVLGAHNSARLTLDYIAPAARIDRRISVFAQWMEEELPSAVEA